MIWPAETNWPIIERAFFESDEAAAWHAIASHPLVDSVAVARNVLDGYLQDPRLQAVLRGHD